MMEIFWLVNSEEGMLRDRYWRDMRYFELLTVADLTNDNDVQCFL